MANPTFPKEEKLWLTYKNKENTYYITSDKDRNIYKLYKLEDDKIVFTKNKSSDYSKLEKYMI